jgi:hypothetical protein
MDIITANNEKLDKTISLITSKNTEVIDFINQFKNIEQKLLVLYSIKLTKHTMLPNRVAIAIDYSDSSNLYTLDNLLNLLNKYNFPKSCVKELTDQYTDSTFRSFNVCVGIEVDENKTRYKVYLEDSITRNLFAVKWDDTTYVVTKYNFRETNLIEETIRETGYDLIPQLILNDKLELTHIYLTQDIINSTRLSFNLAFNNCFLKDISTDVLNLTSVDVLKELDYLKTYPIRILAGGLDANNDKYFTLYFLV